MIYQEARKYAARSGVRVFAVVNVSDNDEICVEIKKGGFIESLSGWTGEATRIDIDLDGNLLMGVDNVYNFKRAL